MTLYLKNGSQFSVTNKADLDIHETLPVGTYTIGFDQNRGTFFLIQVDNFTSVGKIYGDTLKTADRILNTFDDRPGSTGVLLSGDKGSGKTLLSKELSLKGAKLGIPTIVINNAWAGEAFNTFMQNIQQPVIIIFDEFEKVYDSDDQKKLLTLLDGVYTSKKLFVLTTNNPYGIDQHMQNRPGRLFYRKNYKGLDQDFIREYCEDNLENKSHIDSVLRVALLFGTFNFDMLKALVEEMNRYDETAQQALELLNAEPSAQTRTEYDVALSVEGRAIEGEFVVESSVSANPLMQHFDIDYRVADEDYTPDNRSYDWESEVFRPEHIVSVNTDTGIFVLKNEAGSEVVLTKKPAAQGPAWQSHLY